MMWSSFFLASLLLLLVALLVHADDLELLTPIDYTHDGVELQGFKATPEGEGPWPVVIIIP